MAKILFRRLGVTGFVAALAMTGGVVVAQDSESQVPDPFAVVSPFGETEGAEGAEPGDGGAFTPGESGGDTTETTVFDAPPENTEMPTEDVFAEPAVDTPEGAIIDPFGATATEGSMDSPFGDAPSDMVSTEADDTGFATPPMDSADGGFATPPSGDGDISHLMGGAEGDEEMEFALDPFGVGDPSLLKETEGMEMFGGGGTSTTTTTATGTGSQPINPFGDDGDLNSIFDQDVTDSPLTGPPGTKTEAAAAGGAVNEAGIDQLYQFRYERTTLWDGRTVVSRKKLTSEEATEYDLAKTEKYQQDAIDGVLPNFDSNADPQAWAQWAHFSDQMELWSEYVENTVMAGTTLKQSPYAVVQWPGGPRESEQQETRDPNIINDAQNRSLDSQVNDFNPFAGLGGGQDSTFPPEVISSQVVRIYTELEEKLRGLEEDQEAFMEAFEGRIAERMTKRKAYLDWRIDQEQLLEDFVFDWNRRYNGNVAMIGGVRYELYRPGEVPSVVHRDATVVVTDYALTPYDIINPEDGTLKEPPRN